MLTIENLTKRYGTKYPLQAVTLSVAAGEIVGLAERDEIGVSTLISLLSGAITPDSGMVIVNDRRMEWPFIARKAGIGIIYEEPELVDALDIPGNIFIGKERRGFGSWLQILNQHETHKEAARLLDSLGFYLSPLSARARSLSTEQKQLVAIAQVIASDPHLIVIENPSRSLSLPYQEQLLQLMRVWQSEGRAILLCSTNLDHLFAATDRIAILHNGKVIRETPTDRTNREEVVAALVGSSDDQLITPVIWALDSFYQARKKAEMLHHNQQLLKRDLAKQDTINKQLLKQLSLQVNALDTVNLALQDAQRRLLTEREQERKHLARELHDQLIQDLLSLSYQLEDVFEAYADNPEMKEKIQGMRRHTREMVDNLRRICGDLRPPTIDSLGLEAALRSYIANWSEGTGIKAELDFGVEVGRLPEKIELSLFRIVQEGLNNVRNHANASEVSISLVHTTPRMLKIIITDNGVGLSDNFDLGSLNREGHFGLLGITERVALMGGRIHFANLPMGGLQIQVEIPHPRLKNPLDAFEMEETL